MDRDPPNLPQFGRSSSSSSSSSSEDEGMSVDSDAEAKEEFQREIRRRKNGGTDLEIIYPADYFLELADEHLWKKRTVPRSYWKNEWCDMGSNCCMEYYSGPCKCQDRPTVSCYLFSRFVVCKCCWSRWTFGGSLTNMAYRSRDHGPYRKYTYLDLGDLDLIALQ